MYQFIAILVVFFYAGQVQAEPSCSAVQSNWSLCTSLENSALAQQGDVGIADVVTAIKPPFDDNVIYQAFQDPSSCNQACLEPLYKKTQVTGKEKLSLDQGKSKIQEKMVIERALARVTRSLEGLARARENEKFYNYAYGAGKAEKKIVCEDTFKVSAAYESCAQTNLGSKIIQRLKQKHSVQGASLGDLIKGLSVNVINSLDHAKFKCPEAPVEITHGDYVKAISSQVITADMAQVAQSLADEEFMKAVAQEWMSDPTKSKLSIIAKRLAFRSLPISMRSEGSNESSSEYAMVDIGNRKEFFDKLSKMEAMLEHPFLSSLANTNVKNTAVLKNNPIKPGETWKSFTDRVPTLYSNLWSDSNNKSCGAFIHNMGQIICNPLEVDELDPNDSMLASNILENPDSNSAEQVATMSVACSLNSTIARSNTVLSDYTRQTRSFYRSDLADVASQANLVESVNSPRQAISPSDATFLGYARRVCETKEGGRELGSSVRESGIYATGTFVDRSTLRTKEVPIIVTAFSDTDLLSRPIDASSLVLDIKPTLDLPIVDTPATASTRPDQPTSTNVAPPQASTAVTAEPVAATSLAVPLAPVSITAETEVESGIDNNALSTAQKRVASLENELLENRLKSMEAQLAQANQRAAANLDKANKAAAEKPAEVSEEIVSDEEEVVVAKPRALSNLASDIIRAPASIQAAAPVAETPKAAQVEAAITPAPLTPSEVQSLAPADLGQIIDRGVPGLSGGISSRAANISRSLEGLPRAVLVRQTASGITQLVNADGKEIELSENLSDIDLLSVLNDINSNALFDGQVQVQGDNVEITIRGKRIVIDPKRILDPQRKAQIEFLAKEIANRRVQRVRQVFERQRTLLGLKKTLQESR